MVSGQLLAIYSYFLRFFCNFEFQFFSSNCLIFQFLTSDSNSTGRNPPRAHLRMSENLHFEISAPLDLFLWLEARLLVLRTLPGIFQREYRNIPRLIAEPEKYAFYDFTRKISRNHKIVFFLVFYDFYLFLY